MKKLGKVLKTAKTDGINKEKALQDFLRAYRETPHSSTKVAPAMLMMGFSRSSGIPRIEPLPTQKDQTQNLHQRALENDRQAKMKMKQDFDTRMRVKENNIVVRRKRLAEKAVSKRGGKM